MFNLLPYSATISSRPKQPLPLNSRSGLPLKFSAIKANGKYERFIVSAFGHDYLRLLEEAIQAKLTTAKIEQDRWTMTIVSSPRLSHDRNYITADCQLEVDGNEMLLDQTNLPRILDQEYANNIDLVATCMMHLAE